MREKMNRRIFYFISAFVIFAIGFVLLSNAARNTIGAAIGYPLPALKALPLVGMILIVISVLFIIAGSKESELERKLGQMEDVRIRRELLSDALLAQRYAARGFDVNGCWDPRKGYEENKRNFLRNFYRETYDEIREGYRKYKVEALKEPFEEALFQSQDFEKFKEKAVHLIQLWNDNVLKGEFIPLFVRSENPSLEYLGMVMRVVYYGPEALKGKSKKFYDKARSRGEVIAAHEIVNPEAIEHPDKLREVPHIHWELENIMREGYKFR